MTRAQVLSIALLSVAVTASGIGVVYAKYQSRVLFVELQQMLVERGRADQEWGRLQLELATNGALGRVMHIAHDRLQMQIPQPDQIVVVE